MATQGDTDYHALSKPKHASFHAAVSHSDYEKLLQGFTPSDMDDRWVLRTRKADSSTGRGIVSLYRSWTGNEDLRGEFQLTKKVEGSGSSEEAHAIFDKIFWETDPEIRGLQTETEAKDDFVNLVQGLIGVKFLQ